METKIAVFTIATIRVTSLKSREVGQLTIHKHSDISYSVVFHNLVETIQADIDCISIEVKASIIHCRDVDKQCIHDFYVSDRGHLQLFQDAWLHCQQMCNVYLELLSRFRDVYYQSIYSHVRPHEIDENSQINEDLDKLQFQSLQSLLIEFQYGDDKEQNELSSTLPTNETRIIVPSPITTCFYCDQDGKSLQDGSIRFFLHPYVPYTITAIDVKKKSSDKIPVYICSVCLENWHDYREQAKLEDCLLLPGEVNEEICALCSDTPPILVLCSSCPRSYCSVCLAKVLPKEVSEKISLEEDWHCMCCVCKVAVKPLLSKEVWVQAGETIHNAISFGTGLKKALKGRGDKALNSSYSNRLMLGNSHYPAAKSETASKISIIPSTTSKPGIYSNDSQAEKGMLTIAQDTTEEIDEVYYFANYIKYLEKFYADYSNLSKEDKSVKVSLAASRQNFETDDACYLCKDGGELVECDHCYPSHVVPSSSCLKVYHTYCLGFRLPTNAEEKWNCPRHFCGACGVNISHNSSSRLGTEIVPTMKQYQCEFCPLSLCICCLSYFSQQYGQSYCFTLPNINELNTSQTIISIACESCVKLITRAENRYCGDEKIASKGPRSSSVSLERVRFYTQLGEKVIFRDVQSTHKVNSLLNMKSEEKDVFRIARADAFSKSVEKCNKRQKMV